MTRTLYNVFIFITPTSINISSLIALFFQLTKIWPSKDTISQTPLSLRNYPILSNPYQQPSNDDLFSKKKHPMHRANQNIIWVYSSDLLRYCPYLI